MVLFSRTTKTRLRGFVIDEKIALPRKAAFWRKGMDMKRFEILDCLSKLADACIHHVQVAHAIEGEVSEYELWKAQICAEAAMRFAKECAKENPR
jgi:hypothetical protein